jgi:hypothetical protein
MRAVRLFFLLLLVTISAIASLPSLPPRLVPETATLSWLCNEESYTVYCGGLSTESCCGTLSTCLVYCNEICGTDCVVSYSL